MKTYTLSDSYSGGPIDHWLTSGLLERPIPLPADAPGELAARQAVLAGERPLQLAFSAPPVELEPVGPGFWEIRHCLGDHRLEEISTGSAWRRVQRWAYAQVETARSGEVKVELNASGPVALWHNHALVFSSDELQPLGGQKTQNFSFTVHFKRGANHLFVLSEEVAYGPALLSMALRLEGACLEQAALKFLVQNEHTDQRKAIDAIFRFTELSQPVYTRDDQVRLVCHERLMGSVDALLKACDLGGGIYGETLTNLHSGSTTSGMYSIQLPAGPLIAHLTPPHGAYYDEKLRAERKILFYNAPFPYFTQPEGDDESRRLQLIQEMASKDGIFAETAKMHLGWKELVLPDQIQACLRRVDQLEAGCLVDLLGLLGIAARLGARKSFPAGLLLAIQAAAARFPYPQPERGALSDDYLLAGLPAETGRLLALTCELLAAQMTPKETFAASGLTGAQARKRATAALQTLLWQGGQWGWREAGSELDLRVAALAHLVDLAKEDTLVELAAALLDQVAFGLAQYSFKGALAAAQLVAKPAQLKSGRLQPAVALNRLLFGCGGYGEHLLGAFCLAISKNYGLPELITRLAQDTVSVVWTQERSARPAEGWEANLALYKTPDYVLSALQDYYPGETGGTVHPWQATLGPEALVFTSHPASLNQQDHRQAGAWCGSAALPRIAQWQDALICLYRLPEQDPLGFTHAYFPAYAFDEFRQENGWTFARKDNAYLAISASNQARLITWGDDAHCELRVEGLQTAWLVQMGRQAVDGSFAQFCQKVSASRRIIQNLHVDWQTIRGELIEFDWTGPFRRNGQEQLLAGNKRFEGPFVDAACPAETMDIGYGQEIMRLDLS